VVVVRRKAANFHVMTFCDPPSVFYSPTVGEQRLVAARQGREMPVER
jgi:hypothetical protein